jgi:radical SAM protein with 4Fe4S-binding SPASM domain
MKQIEYKEFSLKAHQKNWRIKKPNVCQFELTFKCGLHCRHCYTDCYNNSSDISKELNTKQVKIILDKVYDSGVVWLCFTGGDALTRKDFLEIYKYAKNKGFLITIFTNLCSMTRETADYLGKYPPFVIEMTLNAVTEGLYEQISQVKGSYEKMKTGLRMILDRKLSLKIKTQITKDNFKERESIKKFVENLGLIFRPSILLYPRLNGDLNPCGLRLSPEEILGLDGKIESDCIDDNKLSLRGRSKVTDEAISEENNFEIASLSSAARNDRLGKADFLFRCTAGGGDGFHIDPCGNMFICNLIRKPKVNLLSHSIEHGLEKINPFFKNVKFKTNSKCGTCSIRNICYNCPGNAYLEKNDKEAAVEYHCELARTISAGNHKHSTTI